ncbi:MAG: chromosome segregation protein SMC [Phycisphaerales bacterium]|nr:chromosome segregation protein SMC [Phycisphaerales bacterium]
MRLSKLTLNGFKSFADKTEFTFDQEVTGVVGPNGCGKSNVVDAIKWVLGERSSKSLRGTEMIDVIFAGSAGRKPSGMAAVTLTFENPVVREGTGHRALGTGEKTEEGIGHQASDIGANQEPVFQVDGASDSPTVVENGEESVVDAHVRGKRLLPMDADVVEVERRLYRDGTSKYLINGRNARLRDIRELFLDTGIGADAYSIIEQGKVDAMLLASAQERRVIFEEAAGVAKYKQRRIEAQRKLEKTEVNLTETRTQLESTERRLRIVKGQAIKARKFQALDQELAGNRLALAFEVYDDLRQRLDGLTSRQSGLEEERRTSSETVTFAEQAKQEADITRQELLDGVARLEQSRLSAEHQKQQASQRKAMAERSLEDARRQAGMDEERLGQANRQMMETEASVADLRETGAGLSEQLADAERILQTAGESRAGILEEINDLQAGVNDRRSRVGQIERERSSLQGSLLGDDRRAEAIREQMERLAVRAGGITGELERAQGAGSGHERTVAEVRGLIESIEGDLARHDASLRMLAQGRRERAGRLSELGSEMVRLESRNATLEEMEAAGVGYGETVLAVMQRRATDAAFAGVLGPLAELVDCLPSDIAAIAAGLGSQMQALIVRSLDALPGAGELAGLPGRVMFMPLAFAGRGGRMLMDAGVAGSRSGETGFDEALLPRVKPVRGLVRARREVVGEEVAGGVEGLLDRLLGRTYLVESLDSAMMLAAGGLSDPEARFVTRDGMVLEADGRVLAGPASADTDAGGVLERRSELAALGARIAELRGTLATEQAELAGIDTDAAAMSSLAGELRMRLTQEQRRLVQEQSKLERAIDEAARLGRERGQLDAESGQLRERLEKIDADRGRLRERIESLQRLHGEQALELSGIEEQLLKVRARADAAAEQTMAAKVEVGRLSEQAGAARRELSRLEIARDELGRQVRDLTQHLGHAQARQAEHEQTIAEAAGQIEEHARAAAGLVEEVRSARGLVIEADARVLALAEQVNAARQRSQVVERDWHSLEVSRRELEVKREGLEDRTSEEMRIDLAWDYTEYRAVMADGDVRRIDVAQTEAVIAELRDQIRKLGHVNMEAIAEEDQLGAANETLAKQVADLDAAGIQLKGLIEKLNEASKVRFAEVFGKIQENFGSETGMFRRLFGGGKAEVRLMPLVKEIDGQKVVTDEIDVLESGVEVIAKPPGKEPRSISQLSGGEKTLTAVALLMSIFRSKPSCFCVLDEVDAALDESNVARFGNVVRQFTDLSHFIVITHNKRTMQQADQLYGITMQERGVSKRVSVKFDQVGANGEVTESRSDEVTKPEGEAAAGEPEPVKIVKGSGSLKRALAGMRENGVAVAERGIEAGGIEATSG